MRCQRPLSREARRRMARVAPSRFAGVRSVETRRVVPSLVLALHCWVGGVDGGVESPAVVPSGASMISRKRCWPAEVV